MSSLDILGLDIVKRAEDDGCNARRVHTAAERSPALAQARQSEGPMVLAVTIQVQVPALL